MTWHGAPAECPACPYVGPYHDHAGGLTAVGNQLAESAWPRGCEAAALTRPKGQFLGVSKNACICPLIIP